MSYYVLISPQFEIKDPPFFGNGLRIEAISGDMNVFDLATLGTYGFSEWPLLDSFIHRTKYQIVSDFDGNVQNGYDLLNRCWLLSTMLTHCGYNLECLAVSDRSWSDFIGINKDQARFQNNKPYIEILDYHRQIIKGPTTDKKLLIEEDIDWIGKKFETYNRLAFSHPNFRIALESSVQWKFSNSDRLAIASLWSGIEAIFSINSELVFRISLYIANLLHVSKDNRICAFKKVKELYNMRSKAVHGDKISSEKIIEIIHDSFNILRDLICLIVNNGHILNEDDINDALFGGKET